MKDNPHFRHLFELNFAMILMSTSGVLGRYIDMPPPLVIWWRCFIAAILLWILCRYMKVNLKVNWSADGLTFFIGGALLGLHWITYFYALHLSNVAIGMLSLFTYPAFTALLEPLLLKTRFNPSHLILAILVLFGIYLLTPDFSLETNATKGIAFGLISALMYALRNIILKKNISRYPGTSLMLYQLIIVTLLLTPALYFFDTSQLMAKWPALLALGLFTTAIGHTLFVMSFRHFSVSAASIISSSQPIYGILTAMIFLNEIPRLNTVLGGAIILATVIIESIRSYKKPAEQPARS